LSAIGLGCNYFGRSLDLESSRVVIHKALWSMKTVISGASAELGRTPHDGIRSW